MVGKSNPYLEGTMSGRYNSDNLKSVLEWVGGLGEPTPNDDDGPREAKSADGWGDPFGELDGILRLRRRAQDYKNPPPIRRNNSHTDRTSRLSQFWR